MDYITSATRCFHERNPIYRSHGWAMACLSWDLQMNMTAIYRERTASCFLSDQATCIFIRRMYICLHKTLMLFDNHIQCSCDCNDLSQPLSNQLPLMQGTTWQSGNLISVFGRGPRLDTVATRVVVMKNRGLVHSSQTKTTSTLVAGHGYERTPPE